MRRLRGKSDPSTREVQIAARHTDPRTVYDWRRQGFDRHAAHAVVAFVAGR